MKFLISNCTEKVIKYRLFQLVIMIAPNTHLLVETRYIFCLYKVGVPFSF